MPGYVMHLALAKKILPELNFNNEKDVNDFLIGNIIPDIKKGNEKKKSHFWNDETMLKFERKPDLETFLKQYENIMDTPFILGYYAHLFFDYYFVNSFWKEHYAFYDESMMVSDLYDNVKYVKVIKEGRLYDRETFFSDEYFYGDYSKMVPYISSKYKIEKLQFININNIICEILGGIVEAEMNNMIGRINSSLEIRESVNSLKVFKYEEIDSMIDDAARLLLKNRKRI